MLQRANRVSAQGTGKRVRNEVVVPSSAIEVEEAAIRALLVGGESNHWQIGVHYNNIVDQKLAEKAGYKHARDFFKEQMKDLSQSTLSIYGTVAKTFTEDQAKNYSVSNLGKLLALESLTHTGPLSGDPGLVRIRVPKKGGGVEEKAFMDCSYHELVRAIELARGAAAVVPAEGLAEAKKLQAALVAVLGENGVFRVKAEVKGRQTVISIENVPMAQLSTAIDALKAAV